MKYNNKKGYSVIISMLLIGFLLVLTTTVFNLVLRELRDTRGLWDSVKAFAWAEAAQELALLKIKEKWYGIDHNIQHNVNSESTILSENPSEFKKNKDVLISYDLGIATNSYTEELAPQWYSIIPLFTQSNSNETAISINNYILSVDREEWDLVWNLIASDKGISWTASGGISDTVNWTGKKYEDSVSKIYTQSTSDFLNANSNAYLILFHSWNIWSQNITFTINSADKFSKPKTEIISSAQVGDYRHNLKTDYDNTKFLNMLKYSVFSN